MAPLEIKPLPASSEVFWETSYPMDCASIFWFQFVIGL
jgi:hypothetical protein